MTIQGVGPESDILDKMLSNTPFHGTFSGSILDPCIHQSAPVPDHHQELHCMLFKTQSSDPHHQLVIPAYYCTLPPQHHKGLEYQEENI